MKIAVFGGGCFWCTEAIFKRLKGVPSVISGYAGNPHAEAIQIQFNPSIISFKKILEIFWATHDPTTLNRQGADVGTQYRSVIFYHNEKQKEEALKLKQPSFVTEIVPFDKFYKAEDYHQNFYEKNKNSSYCQIVINPKIQKLLVQFKKDVKENENN